MKVLISAFKPFNKANNNYSYEVLKHINNVDKILIDVVYDECFKELTNHYNLDNYDLIIALGEARSRSVLTLEQNAKNISSCSIPDNLGNLKKDEKIMDNDDILYTKVEINKVKDIVEFSSDAGKFVCNNLYYHLLAYNPYKTLFIHIPNCLDEESNYIKYARVIEKIIDKLK